jgi:hypothetical protein
LPNFQGVPLSFDFGNLSQLHSLDTTAATTSTTHITNGTKSDGSSVTYLSTPSSSTNQLFSSMFNDQDLNSSPTSLNPAATTFPFGASFDKPQNTAPSFTELPYPATQQPAINSCNASGSVPVTGNSSLDGSFTHNQLAGHNFSTAGYNLSNQFNLPVNSSIA